MQFTSKRYCQRARKSSMSVPFLLLDTTWRTDLRCYWFSYLVLFADSFLKRHLQYAFLASFSTFSMSAVPEVYQQRASVYAYKINHNQKLKLAFHY